MIERIARGFGLGRQSYAPKTPEGGVLEAPRGTDSRAASMLLGSRQPIGGERVSVEGALGIGTVYSCVRILAETVGTTPLLTYAEDSRGRRERSRNSIAWSLLHDEPNPGMSAVDFLTLITTWLVGWGDAFIGLERHGRELAALWPIHPADVDVRITNARRTYEVRRRDGTKQVFTPQDVVHVMGQSFDGLRGASPLSIARSEIAMTMAAQKMATSTFANAAVPRGVLTYEQQLSDDAMKRVRADWQRIYGGSQNAGKVAILEEGMDFKAVSMPLRDVQWIEQQQLSVQVIARLFRVPLSLIQADSPGGLTYRTAETENLQFLTHGVRPWFVRIEQALNRVDALFPGRPVEFCEFLPAALLRVATKERFESYAIATGGKPWMRPSEVRDAENLSVDDEIDADAEPPEPVVVAPAEPEPAQIEPPASDKAEA